jgi:hypothetical protein
MTPRKALARLLGVAAVVFVVRCGGGSSSPTQPVPTPVPTATPAPTPTPGSGLPEGLVCDPTPPPLYGMKVKIHDDSPTRKILDSKPLVMNVDGYCARVGSGGATQKFCDTRPEGDLQRVACDYLATGQADTGRWGPTWTWNDQPCDGVNFTSCANQQDNQFMAIAKASGGYAACAAADRPVDPNGQRCGGIDIVIK